MTPPTVARNVDIWDGPDRLLHRSVALTGNHRAIGRANTFTLPASTSVQLGLGISFLARGRSNPIASFNALRVVAAGVDLAA